MENKKNNDLYSEEHTLFVRYVPETRRIINRQRQQFEIIPKYRIFIVYVEKFNELKRGLHAVLNELRTATKDDVLELRINSSGGLVNEGKQFYNLIQEKFYHRSVAYLDNKGYSMGALLFCMADRRVVYPYSDLMFHNYSSGLAGKGGEIMSRVEHKDKILIAFFKNIIVENGFLSEDEFQKMLIGKDYWMNAEQMCERGIATHVIVEGKEMKAKKYLKHLKRQREAD